MSSPTCNIEQGSHVSRHTCISREKLLAALEAARTVPLANDGDVCDPDCYNDGVEAVRAAITAALDGAT